MHVAMDFASLMSSQIAKGKVQAASKDSTKKYVKRSEVEAQREAAYRAEQEALEAARREKLNRKRKAEEEEAARERERNEKRRKLAEESKRRRQEEDAASERERRKRLGLPDIVNISENDEGALSEGQEETSEEELRKKLRELGEPAMLFGETFKQRLRRYHRLTGQGARELVATLYDGPIPTTLKPVQEAEMKVDGKVPANEAGRAFLFRQLGSYFSMVLMEWELALAKRSESVRTSFEGKQAYNAMIQALSNMRPLYKKLEKGELEDGILEPVVEIVKAAQERRYVDANDGYLRLSIGKA